MPHGLTMLARGLTNMEGVLADIAPQINMIEIASRHISESMWKDLDWKKELKHAGKNLYRSMHKAVEVPGLAADALHGLMKGQTRVNLDLHASNDLAQLLRRLVRNVVMGLWVMALLISFKHYLHYQYEPEDLRNPGNWCDWVFICICDCDVCAY